tara:strand:- start:318 stop:467 length:150 start_codon:yes stop_codon:yes gene_type:complete
VQGLQKKVVSGRANDRLQMQAFVLRGAPPVLGPRLPGGKEDGDASRSDV